MPNCVSKLSVVMSLLRPLNEDVPDGVHYRCQMENCSSILSGKKKWNLVSHFECKHAMAFSAIMKETIANQKLNVPDLEERRLRHIQYLTEIVTVNGRAFMCLTDSGLMGLASRELKFLQSMGRGDGLVGRPPVAVISHIEYLSSEIISAIKLEVKDSLVSLMMDIGSRNGRDLLGLSLQYMRDDQIVIRTIGMIEQHKSHTAANIAAEIIACLQKFDTKPQQVITITSDNASNMLATVKLFSRISDPRVENVSGNEYESDDSEQMDEQLKNADIYDDDFIQAEISEILDEYNTIQSTTEAEFLEMESRDAEIQEILDDSSDFIELLKTLQNEFAMRTLNSHGIKCAAHTLQLAVNKALKWPKIRVLIAMCRVACKLLRKAAYKNRIREQNLEIVLPKLDCKVRWNSTYEMVCSNMAMNDLSKKK